MLKKDLYMKLIKHLIQHIQARTYGGSTYCKYTFFIENTKDSKYLIKRITPDIELYIKARYTPDDLLQDMLINHINLIQDHDFKYLFNNGPYNGGVKLVIIREDLKYIERRINRLENSEYGGITNEGITNVEITNEGITNVEITNGEKTFKPEECMICLDKEPNVMFCSCGHICICSTCRTNLTNKNKCISCKLVSVNVREI